MSGEYYSLLVDIDPDTPLELLDIISQYTGRYTLDFYLDFLECLPMFTRKYVLSHVEKLSPIVDYILNKKNTAFVISILRDYNDLDRFLKEALFAIGIADEDDIMDYYSSFEYNKYQTFIDDIQFSFSTRMIDEKKLFNFIKKYYK